MKKQLLLLLMILLPMVASAYDFEVDGICYTITSVDNLTVEVATNSNTETKKSNYKGDIVIPSSVVYNNITFSVTGIGEAAFAYYEKSPGNTTYAPNQEVTSVSLPSTINYLDTYSFFGNSFNNIELPSNITRIGFCAFERCINLKEIVLGDKVEQLGFGCFSYCTSLQKIKIPLSIKEIGAQAFDGCNSLVEVNIPNSITSLRFNIFRNCSSLSAITIPLSVVEIEDNSFDGCSSLTHIDLPESITSIARYAFINCVNLKEVILPSSLQSIQIGCFEGCNNLIDVKSKNRNPFDIDETIFPNLTYMFGKLYVPEEAIDLYKQHQGWNKFANIVKLDIPKHTLYYTVDGEVYKSYQIEEGATITPEAEPTKEGYTFSGWSEIPETMPAHDVTVTGTFSINKYKLTYTVDGTEYKTYEVEYGAAITPEAEPTKEGYTFSGWSEIPQTMPANDVMVTGSFAVNKYKLTYVLDGEVYKSYDVEYGSKITPEPDPTKEGYSFSGWSGIPETMPAHDVTVTGTFTKGAYKLTYYVDGEVYKTVSYDYGAAITPEAAPTKEGYTFSGWSEIPETMPAHDVTVTSTFSINKYKLTYKVDGEEYKTYEVEYGATITPEPAPTKDGCTFSGWSYIPKKMPAEDVTVIGSFTINSYDLTYMIDEEVYKVVAYNYGATIVPEAQPEGDYASFEWVGLPETMPAHDVIVHASYVTGITDIALTEKIVRIYSPNGKILNKLQKGLNLVLMRDGTIRKIVIK